MIYRLAEPIPAQQPGKAPASLNEKLRTVDVVFATETPVVRYDISVWNTIRESLRMTGADLSAMPGAPVLDAHRQGTVAAILGVVERAWIQGTEARAVIRFGQSVEAESAFQAVKSGVLRGISVGFEIISSGPAKKQVTGEPTLIEVTRWKPMEISLCPIGADAMTGIRSAGLMTRAALPTGNSTPALTARAAAGDTIAAAIQEVRSQYLAGTTHALEKKILENFCKAQTP
jgi:hypothetical protein